MDTTFRALKKKIHNLEQEKAELKAENKTLKDKLDKFRTDNIYEEGLYD